MKNYWLPLVQFIITLLFFNTLSAQQRDTTFRNNDTTRMRRGGGFNSIFADTAKLTTSDYQLRIEKAYVILDHVQNKTELGLPIRFVKERLADTDSVLAVLKDNILNNSRALNLRNLQVFRTLLQNMQADLRERREILDSTERTIDRARNNMKPLLEDTVLRQVMRDSALRLQFSAQLKDMRQAFRTTTRQVRKSLNEVNSLQTHVSSNIITSTQLLEKVNTQLSTSAERIFGKEVNYLWEKDTSVLSKNARLSFTKAYDGERKSVRYYFKDSGNKRLFLLLIGLIFFIWTFRNIRALKKRQALNNLNHLPFSYLPSGYIVSALVVMFSIAPLFDLHAPSVYIESMQFLLLIILTIICWSKWPRKLFMVWIAMAVLYVLFSFTHHIPDPGWKERWGLMLLNVLSIIFGLQFLSGMKEHLRLRGFLRFVIILHNVMNGLSLLCNIFGRFTLAQLLGNAAIFSFMQAVGLAVFSQICLEAILLQIVASRVKQGGSNKITFEPVLKSFGRLVLFIVVLLWLIVFTTNLNIYNSLMSGVGQLLTTPRHIGNASFTVGGVLLFFLIIWVAHLLQKYVGYFFGDTGQDEEIQNKSQRSRLLITRLILLCLGYLLAVAASGVPVDKITIVLGALGVGIGLGLQNIVNNFVSGIILIFDRPLQIGDIVKVGDHSGKVREIGLRSSTLLTSDGAEVIIPNGDILSTQIVNWTLTNAQQRLGMELNITGTNDIALVTSTIKQALSGSKFTVKEKEPQILITKVLTEGFSLQLFAWIMDAAKSDEANSEIVVLLTEELKKHQLQIA